MISPRRIIYDLVAGDNGPPLEVRFEGLSLADYSAIKLKMERSDGTRISRDVTPDGEDVELGSVVWGDNDLILGDHQVEFQFTRTSDAKIFTLPRRYPVLLRVRGDLG